MSTIIIYKCDRCGFESPNKLKKITANVAIEINSDCKYSTIMNLSADICGNCEEQIRHNKEQINNFITKELGFDKDKEEMLV